MVSILILTKNEEQDLPACLESVRWSDDVHVFDSGSTDATQAVAEEKGAHVTVRSPGDSQEVFGGNEAEHTNWAIANLPFKHDWVLHIAADERVTAELAERIQQAVADPGEKIAFRVKRRDFWGRRWLKHAVATSAHIRLFRPQKMRYQRLVNPVAAADGPVGDLEGFLDHYPFSKGMSHWLRRHNSYSTLEAQQIVENRRLHSEFSVMEAFFGSDRTRRRFHQKEFFYRLPGRPVVKFFMLYLGKGGFLDGREGFYYALLQSFYEGMIVLKADELSRRSMVFQERGELAAKMGARERS